MCCASQLHYHLYLTHSFPSPHSSLASYLFPSFPPFTSTPPPYFLSSTPNPLPSSPSSPLPLFPFLSCPLPPSLSQPEFEFGAIYPVTVKEVREYGVMVELAPGVEALLHKSQISHRSHRTVSWSGVITEIQRSYGWIASWYCHVMSRR